MVTQSIDVTVSNHGSLYLCLPESDAARAWIDENVQPDAQWFGNALVVEPRYVDNLVSGMRDAGLVVEVQT